ncbi:MAG: UDP-2,4-diacetamido-2,4,6-trideoxy-beta-L-altropyranose hydrolase [Syntrophorhabdaceae bacterium]|nr:UDP-2,4-diacetamido-2,4,6-trideoxy-beta-L-altropyranose hydrolase [Syntrophorhabdaceae bacterium]MDD5242395.1 UDP-2,4-diacetamido-2,4,6-trideoxy-beta-L-altropyranose hydrolase [Syntrophorhabdaceae bacterium]
MDKVKDIYFRADSSVDIGTGHIMRCLTLADVLRKRGLNIHFICRKYKGNINHIIEKRGYIVHGLPPRIMNKTDMLLTEEILKKENRRPDLLVSDHYGIDASWESHIKGCVRRVMVIDDFTSRRHHCDLLLNQNLYRNMEKRYKGMVPEGCRMLLGAKYILLREQFLPLRKKQKQFNKDVKRILVFVGGTDPTNETMKALKAIELLNRDDILIDVVVGVTNPNKDTIKKVCALMPNARYYCQVDNIEELLFKADMAIGSGGSASWERCFIGVPSIIMSFADNQREISENLHREGIAINLGWYEEITSEDIAVAIRGLMNNPAKRMKMISKGKNIVDGKGAYRVADAIQKMGEEKE